MTHFRLSAVNIFRPRDTPTGELVVQVSGLEENLPAAYMIAFKPNGELRSWAIGPGKPDGAKLPYTVADIAETIFRSQFQ